MKDDIDYVDVHYLEPVVGTDVHNVYGEIMLYKSNKTYYLGLQNTRILHAVVVSEEFAKAFIKEFGE